jgi:hypothetical protein
MVINEAPVFQPTKENLLENQYSGRLYLGTLLTICEIDLADCLTMSKFDVPLVWARDLY